MNQGFGAEIKVFALNITDVFIWSTAFIVPLTGVMEFGGEGNGTVAGWIGDAGFAYIILFLVEK